MNEMEIITGLSLPQKSLPAKLLYDEKGSEIFEEICELPTYYPTRTEKNILTENAREISGFLKENSVIIEPGSGAAEKVRILFRQMSGRLRYVPVEISREILVRTTNELKEEFPGIEILPIFGDFTFGLTLPDSIRRASEKKILFFPGSTIGNLDPKDAGDFLKQASRLIGADGGVLIGVDRKKSTRTLQLAYNDPEGVTATFNLNLLNRINRELDAAFDPESFQHEAIYNEKLGRIEMHLISKRHQLVRVHDSIVRFREGESIHTENSYKYTVSEFTDLAQTAGLLLKRYWEDSEALFTVYYFENE